MRFRRRLLVMLVAAAAAAGPVGPVSASPVLLSALPDSAGEGATGTDAAGAVDGGAASEGATDVEAATSGEAPPLVSYLEVLEHVEMGNVVEASFADDESLVRLRLLDGSFVEGRYPPYRAPMLVVALLEAGVVVRALPDAELLPFGVADLDVVAAPGEGSSSTLSRLMVLLPFLGLAVVGVVMWRFYRRSSRPAPPGSSELERPTVTFADVAGCDEAVEDLRELVEFLREPERFERLGAKVPRGAILVGPPGTGKTLLAKAVAGEAGVAFFAQAGSDFVELYVGVGAKRVRDLFAKARKEPAAIVFIDEIDAIGRARSGAGAINGGNDERENTLIALLNELDGFNGSRVVVIAATNRVDILDPALLRPGRLDRKISVPNPDRRGREHILKVHTENKPLAGDVDLEKVAARTPGASGAELAFIANEAALEAARLGLEEVSAACFAAAVETMAMGRPRKSALVTQRDREITAWHEAGHALVALLDPEADDPVAVSIVPRGAAGGVTWMSGSDDQYLSRSRARARLAVALAGRVGEEFLLDGEFTQGAASDLLHATDLAGHMVTSFGMTRRGLMVRRGGDGFDAGSAEVVEELLTEAQEHARRLLTVHMAALERLAGALLERESLAAEEIRMVVAGESLPVPLPPARREVPVSSVRPSVVSGLEPVPVESGGPLRKRVRRLLGRERVHG